MPYMTMRNTQQNRQNIRAITKQTFSPWYAVVVLKELRTISTDEGETWEINQVHAKELKFGMNAIREGDAGVRDVEEEHIRITFEMPRYGKESTRHSFEVHFDEIRRWEVQIPTDWK